MLHDILITVGVYSLAVKEVSIATVAAVLTVLGYSIYDTIIIFDRIRENVPLMRRQPFATIANVSLWETIRRSLATTFITLLPIVALEILGGATLKDFAFALHRRRHLGRLLLDLHRRAAAHDLEGARAGVSRSGSSCAGADDGGRDDGRRVAPRRSADAALAESEAGARRRVDAGARATLGHGGAVGAGARRRAARSAASAAARGRMAARGSGSGSSTRSRSCIARAAGRVAAAASGSRSRRRRAARARRRARPRDPRGVRRARAPRRAARAPADARSSTPHDERRRRRSSDDQPAACRRSGSYGRLHRSTAIRLPGAAVRLRM